jgi:hypothetical protein
MRGKLDENMPVESVGLLQAGGWECDTVFDEALSGSEDPAFDLLVQGSPILPEDQKRAT